MTDYTLFPYSKAFYHDMHDVVTYIALCMTVYFTVSLSFTGNITPPVLCHLYVAEEAKKTYGRNSVLIAVDRAEANTVSMS